MEATCYSETSVDFQPTTKDRTLHNDRGENLGSYMFNGAASDSEPPMAEWLICDDLERMWKEAAMVYSKILSRNRLKGLRKFTNLSQDTRCPGRSSNGHLSNASQEVTASANLVGLYYDSSWQVRSSILMHKINAWRGDSVRLSARLNSQFHLGNNWSVFWSNFILRILIKNCWKCVDFFVITILILHETQIEVHQFSHKRLIVHNMAALQK
jgi:hypothetical protein